MTAWPLDNTEYTAEAIGAWSGTRTRGVFSAEGCFAVTAAGGFGIQISPGLAWLKAAEYWGIAVLEKVAAARQIEVGSGLLPRYVAVVLQYDKTANDVRLTLRYGDYSDAPAKPQPVRDEYYDEIILASILQPAAAVEITQANITDERLNEAMCGLMRDGVTGMPTAQLFAQARAQLDGYASEFEAWFARMQGQLSQDAAGNLQLQVDALGAEVQLFACTLLADGWQPLPAEGGGAAGGGETEESGGEAGGETAAAQAGDDTGGSEGGGETEPPAVTVYTQTVPCPGLLAAYDLEAPQVPTTGVQATDAALKEGLDALCEAGNCGETLDGQLKWTCYGSHPTVDLPLRLRRAMVESAPDAGGGQGPETPAGPGSGEEVQPDENL